MMTNAQQNPSDENKPLVDNSSHGGSLVSAQRPGGGQVAALAPRPFEIPEGSGFNPREYWRILNKRKWLIASIISASLMIGWLQTLMSIPMYISTIRIQIETNVNSIVEHGNVNTPVDADDSEFLRTQYELIQSRSLADRVVSMARLGDDAAFLKPRQFSILSMLRGGDKQGAQSEAPVMDAASRQEHAVGIVMANRSVRPVSGSRLVDISYADPSPVEAQRVAQTYGEAFIAATLDKRFQANSYAKAFLEDQVAQLKLQLEKSEKVLLDFAQKEQIVATTDKASIAETNLAAASAALGNIIAERIKNEQLWKQAQSATAINLPQLLSNSVIEGLRAKRNQLVTEFQEKSETFQPSYPS